ncbi:hypothetical protein BDN70DRAFT_890765 [Pholiota conissans]|uniref:Uncharacterized protein n=1 Tax=Pholiota conissans TaxID=109636 RepID=A0A9P5ZD17_9AGAR|nr:hypothetical protein BDN70DRAFT_890765 [Pholiota conissans]
MVHARLRRASIRRNTHMRDITGGVVQTTAAMIDCCWALLRIAPFAVDISSQERLSWTDLTDNLPTPRHIRASKQGLEQQGSPWKARIASLNYYVEQWEILSTRFEDGKIKAVLARKLEDKVGSGPMHVSDIVGQTDGENRRGYDGLFRAPKKDVAKKEDIDEADVLAEGCGRAEAKIRSAADIFDEVLNTISRARAQKPAKVEARWIDQQRFRNNSTGKAPSTSPVDIMHDDICTHPTVKPRCVRVRQRPARMRVLGQLGLEGMRQGLHYATRLRTVRWILGYPASCGSVGGGV